MSPLFDADERANEHIVEIRRSKWHVLGVCFPLFHVSNSSMSICLHIKSRFFISTGSGTGTFSLSVAVPVYMEVKSVFFEYLPSWTTRLCLSIWRPWPDWPLEAKAVYCFNDSFQGQSFLLAWCGQARYSQMTFVCLLHAVHYNSHFFPEYGRSPGWMMLLPNIWVFSHPWQTPHDWARKTQMTGSVILYIVLNSFLS